MSKQTKISGINKCISSRLWYTSLNIFHDNNFLKEVSCNYYVDLTNLETIIQTLIHSPNEEQYQWIAYILLWKLANHKSNTDYDITRNIQTQLNYIQIKDAINLCGDVPNCVYKELSILFHDVECNMNKALNSISQEVFTFLKNSICKNPSIVCWIINKLISTVPISYDVNNLQDIYFSAMKLFITYIPIQKNWYISPEIFDSCSIEADSTIHENHLEIIVCLLSKIEINLDKEIEFLKTVYPILSKTHNIEDIELSLYSRKNEKLLKEWLLLWNETHAYSDNAINLDIAYRISETIFKLTDNLQIVLCERELLKRISMRKLHWLNDILDISYTLAMNKKYSEVELLLSSDLLKELYPLLLFKALNDCPQKEINSFENCDSGILICESINFLLENCCSNIHSDCDLNKLYALLKNHMKIVEYILQYKKRCFTRPKLKEQKALQSNTFEEIVSIKQILFLLQKSNVLSVLKMTTNIHDQNYDIIQNLLQGSDESIINTFRAYCSISCALKAILLCEFYDMEHKQIVKYFADMVSHLSSLFPLSLRIETMENIFSLLFLRYEDFNATSADCEYDSESTLKKTGINKSLEYERSGFICNSYATRDILYYLWDSIKTATYEIKKLEILNENEEMKRLHENLSAFTSASIDARWKLEFYMKPHFVENIGLPEEQSYNSSVTNKSEIVIPSKSNRTKDDTFFYKGDSTSDETKIKSDSSSESVLLGNNRGKKRPRNTTITDSLITKDRQSLINLMLAPKESLISHCLWKNDIEKAQEVIKMFHMEKTQLNGEVQFLDAFHVFKLDTFKYTHIMDTKNLSKGNSKSSTLENIRLAAEEGVQTSRHTNQVETFLASQEPYLRMLSTDTLNSNEMLTFSILDLSLTIGQTHQISNNFCDVAMKYLRLCKTFDDTEHARLFSKIYQLFYEIKNNISVTTILCDAKIPFSIKEWKENNAFWSDLKNNYCTFNAAEKSEIIEKSSCDDILGLKTIKKMSATYSNDQKFLQNICSHLQLLCTIIPDTNNDIKIRTASDLLKISLYHYFGYQIFDLQTEPDKLETIASNLQVNLIYSILINICPNIFCYEEKSYTSNEDFGCIILNKNQDKSGVKNVAVKSPNEYISEILTELLQVLYNVSSGQLRLNNSYLRSISNHTDIQTVLSKTSSLAILDLSELSVGDETLTFFLNVWNVMFLHANLTIWSKDPPFNSLRHMVSTMSVGYMIGDLGLVTLASLRSKLLGNLMNDFKFFTQLEELNELAWQDLDLIQNPKVIFAMANEFSGTPEIRVYETQTLNESLEDATRNYFSHYLSNSLNDDFSISLAEQKLSLPDFTRLYRCAISHNNSNVSTNANENLADKFEILNKNVDAQYVALNYTYEIILKYSEHAVPPINTINSIEKSLWQTRTLRPNLLQYIERHCWLLSYLVQRIHDENPTILENSGDDIKRTACLENLLYSPWVDKLKSLFNDNRVFSVIHDNIPVQDLWNYFELNKEECNWENSLEILNALTDNAIKSNMELRHFKDLILSHLLSNLDTVSIIQVLRYLYQIKDIHILAQTVLHNVNKWPMNVCEHALLHILQHEHNYKLPIHCKHRMNGILCRITMFHKMIPYCICKANSTWYDVMYCTEKIETFQIIRSLINADQFELCLEWLECQAFSLEIQPSVIQDFLIGLLKNQQQDFKQAVKFLKTLSTSQAIKLCKGVLKKVESTDALQFVANYLFENCSKPTEASKYRRTLIGVNILKILENKERALYIHLIKEPLLMLEQLLMNCKFESIQKILNTLHEELQHTDISIDNFDKVIRFYAKRSLDFRISLQRDNTENKMKNIQQSNLEVEGNEFVMPVNVPTKEEWVPNDKVRECSCCKVVIFSMFNRRHHCRRCGRVVCAICSQHRMQVAGYPDSVLVRVCDDCKRYTALQIQTIQDTPSISSNEVFDYWRLTRDDNHNRTIRDEFSFEHAPNISLCLTILNLHSDHQMYTSFLLDRCDEMKQFLQPGSDGRINPEIDHAVIIKMIRSLLVAAKVKCAKLGFNTGLAHCDRFLSQVDLIAILIQSDCLALIPTDELDDHTLRKLRDLLTEKEQWILALDVSTKAGLDTQGVWAAWGKACLKVGYFDQARDKFYHCLDKIVYEDFDDWVMLTYSIESAEEGKRDTETIKKNKTANEEGKVNESHSKKEFLKYRPLKDPPLLTEILQILDNLSIHRSRTQHSSRIQHSSQIKSDVAQEILQTLNNLKFVSQNQFTTKHLNPFNQTVYYQESLYYLLTYGSYNSILQFFSKHKEFDKCLAYILENDLEPDLFLNGIYLSCLKNGDSEKLYDTMKARDPTLVVWKKYLIYICHYMERKQYWHILYQIQLFMKDYVRASMTCIRFYISDAYTYLDLHNRAHLLRDAQKHLESELQIENLNKRKKSTCSVHSSGQSILTMEMEPSEIDRHINTICRQAEIAKFLANCEKEERVAIDFLNLFPDIDCNNYQTPQLPTLFGDQQQKIHLAILAILCGRDIEEGFGIAFRIMQDYNLPQQKVYSLAGHVLALKNNISAIEQLVKCCRSSGAPNAHANSDYVLTHCVKLLLNHSYNEQDQTFKNHIDSLVRLIIDTELRINAYIESKQLKAAYLLAVKHSRVQDIKRILKESDRLGQSAIKAICLKWLQQKPKI